VPVKSTFAPTTDEMIVQGERILKEAGLVAPGDRLLMLAGHSHTAGATNMLRVHSVE
jgi:pyruvate kinase